MEDWILVILLGMVRRLGNGNELPSSMANLGQTQCGKAPVCMGFKGIIHEYGLRIKRPKHALVEYFSQW